MLTAAMQHSCELLMFATLGQLKVDL